MDVLSHRGWHELGMFPRSPTRYSSMFLSDSEISDNAPNSKAKLCILKRTSAKTCADGKLLET